MDRLCRRYRQGEGVKVTKGTFPRNNNAHMEDRHAGFTHVDLIPLYLSTLLELFRNMSRLHPFWKQAKASKISFTKAVLQSIKSSFTPRSGLLMSRRGRNGGGRGGGVSLLSYDPSYHELMIHSTLSGVEMPEITDPQRMMSG